MNKKAVFSSLLIVLLIVALILLTSCGARPPKEPKEMVREANELLFNANSWKTDFTAKGSFTPKDESATPFHLDASGALAFDKKDPNDIRFDFSLNLKGDRDKDSGALALDVRMVKKTLYVRLNDFTLPLSALTVLQDMKDTLNLIKGKWLSVVLPPEVVASAPDFSFMREAVLDTSLYGDIAYKGTKKVNGKKTFSYAMKSTPETFKKVAERLIGDTSAVPESDKKSAAQFTAMISEMLETEGLLQVDAETSYPVQTSQTFFIKGKDGKEAGQLTMTVNYSDFGSVRAIEAPESAVPFDPAKLFGAKAVTPVSP